MALRSITYAAKEMKLCPRTLKSLVAEGKIEAVQSSTMKHPKISDRVIQEYRGDILVKEKLELKERDKQTEINPFTGRPFPKKVA